MKECNLDIIINYQLNYHISTVLSRENAHYKISFVS